MNVALGNLGLSAGRLFTPLIVTHVSIRTSDTSSKPLDSPSQAYGTLLYRVSTPFNTLFTPPLYVENACAAAPQSVECVQVEWIHPELRYMA